MPSRASLVFLASSLGLQAACREAINFHSRDDPIRLQNMALRGFQLLLSLGVFMVVLIYLYLAFDAVKQSQIVTYKASITPDSHPIDPAEATRIIAIGDLHGDFAAFKQILEFTKADWTTTVVHTGDTIDRGDDTIQLLDFFISAPSNYRHIMGNHELMNLADNLNYVSAGDFKSFGGKQPRHEAFAVGGKYGDYLRTLGKS